MASDRLTPRRSSNSTIGPSAAARNSAMNSISRTLRMRHRNHSTAATATTMRMTRTTVRFVTERSVWLLSAEEAAYGGYAAADHEATDRGGDDRLLLVLRELRAPV